MANENQIAVLETQVAKRVTLNFVALNRSGIKYPVGYVPENAIKSALFELTRVKDKNGVSIVDKAPTNKKTFNSIINAINDMLIQGLDVGKKQAYFIPYEDEVQLQRSYFGTTQVLQRLPEIKEIKAFAYYSDNVPEFGFDVTTMTQTIKNFQPHHESDMLAGAFAVITKADGQHEVTIMNLEEILESWRKSPNWGETVWLNTPEEVAAAKKNGAAVKTTKAGKSFYKVDKPNDVQNHFAGEMAKRTVINRAAKLYVNSSTAPTQLIEAYNSTTENEYTEPKEAEVIPERDYAAEIKAAKTEQELNILWQHTVPDEQKADLLDNFQERLEELDHELPVKN